MPSVPRRFVLKSLASGVALASNHLAFGSAARNMPAQKMSDTFVMHNDLPWALETRRSQFDFGPITPASYFFVRNNLPMPSESETGVGDDWVFDVLGCERKGQLTVADLKRMKTKVVATVLQCSGNGRDFSRITLRGLSGQWVPPLVHSGPVCQWPIFLSASEV